MESPILSEKKSDYYIYDALVESWLNREKLKEKNVNTKGLSDACIILATVLNTRGVRKIKDQDLNRLIEQIENVKLIKKVNIKGRSLINRDSEGNWRFSHFSIQEFCVTKLLLEKKVFTPKKSIHVSDLIFKWIAEFKKEPHFCRLLDFNDVQLENAKLSGICLPGANLAGLNFKGADLSGADLSETNLLGADLKGAKTEGANFEGAKPKLLRSKPLTVYDGDSKKTFRLTDKRRPLEYIVPKNCNRYSFFA
ncbi:pentapeptide repeat-containing protein [Desulfococcaceae bacterium HSG9]|nr:pentapeptide repeat-containing protein [Desulfococcaceae bacterium HSG9]